MTLAEIFEKVKMENAQSKLKYGPWLKIAERDQGAAIQGEYVEWHRAYCLSDTDGEHGEIEELIDLMNVCARRIQFLTGEEDA